MTGYLLMAIVMGLLWYGLERNHARNAALFTRLPFGMDAENRDTARFRAELRAARDHERLP
ncbi:MAG TPA: hypothetical protein VGH99_07810 [Pseudonocardia sp.]|jgi:hypothetical protein